MTDVNLHMRHRVTYRCLAVLLFVCAALDARDAGAQVRGVSYTLAPTGGYVYWDPNAGLREGLLFGGQLGFGLGQYFELNGLYMVGYDFARDFTRFQGADPDMQDRLALLDRRDVNLQRFGAELTINMATGAVIPFVRGGTGVIRFSPENLNPSETIYLSAGAGLRLSLADRYALTLEAEGFGYRYHPGAAFLSGGDYLRSGLEPQNFRSTLVNNWTARAGLGIYIGGRRPGELSDLDLALRSQFAGGLAGLSLQIEPYFGQIDFNPAFNYAETQRVIGGSLGLDFGPLVGLRAFYWQGLEGNNFTDFAELRLVGGEVKMNLSRAQGIVPYLLLGGGYIDVGEDYVGRGFRRPESEPFAMGGAGLRFNLIPNLRLEGGVRVMLMNTEGFDNQTSPSRVYASPMYSGGISFGIGRRVPDVDIVPRERVDELIAEERARAAAREEELSRRIAEAFARGDTAAVLALADERDALLRRLEDPRLVEPVPPRERRVFRDPEERTMTIPVPTEGEIYIRYGPPGGVSIETYPEDPDALFAGTGLTAAQIRRVTRETIRDVLAQEGLVPTPETDDLRAMERRLEERILAQLGVGVPRPDDPRAVERRLDQLERRITQRMREELAMVRAERPTVIRPDPPAEWRPVTPADRAMTGFAAVAGINLMGGVQQYLLGAKADYGTLFGVARLLPEFILGMGGGTMSYNLNANAVIPFRLDYIFPWSAYAGSGVGLIAFSSPPEDVMGFQATLNIIAGAERVFGSGTIFVEYANLNLFRFNRINSGFRLRF